MPISEPLPISEKPVRLSTRERYTPILLVLFLLLLGLLAYDFQRFLMNVLLLEMVHAGVVISIFVACLVYQKRYPHIRQFGWYNIVWGIGLLMFGTIIDIIDNPPGYGDYYGLRIVFPIGATWETAYLKKMIGYASGISLFAIGFFRWIPWMIETRNKVEKLNEKLSTTNRNLNRALMSLDEHIESERVNISRELHDDVAQQLTYVNVQAQLCRRLLEAGDADGTREKLDAIGGNVSEALKSVRQISSDLRPESLFSLGLIPALEQFIEKIQQQNPGLDILLEFHPAPGETHTRFEEQADDHALLHLFRIVQEGIRNAVKHAGQGPVHILLEECLPDTDKQVADTNALLVTPNKECDTNGWGEEGSEASDKTSTKSAKGRLRICIEDRGKGLPWQAIPPDDVLIQQGHLGIVGLKERVRELSGTFSLTNRSDAPGARLEIILA